MIFPVEPAISASVLVHVTTCLRGNGSLLGDLCISYEIRTFMYQSNVEGSMFIVGLFFRDLHNSLSFK